MAQCARPLHGADGENEEEEEDYSFSLSGLPEEKLSDANQAKLIEESISFSFSTEYPSETECPQFGFTSTLPLLGYSRTQAAMADEQAIVIPDDSEDGGKEESAPFQVSGSWPGEVSLRHLSRNSESRCSFSSSPDLEQETEHLEDCRGPINIVRAESTLMHTAYMDVARRHINVRDNLNHKAGDGKGSHADIESPQDGPAFRLFCKRALSDPAASGLRFAGEGLLQPWSSSKLSKSCGNPAMTKHRSPRDKLQASSHGSVMMMNNLYPLPCGPTVVDVQQESPIKKMVGTHGASYTQPLSPPPSALQGRFPSIHGALYPETRKPSGLFVRRMQNTTDSTLSVLVNTGIPNPTFIEGGHSSPSTGSSSGYRTSSNGSARSSSYSSCSSGKGTAPNSRSSSSQKSPLVNVGCSPRQRTPDGKPPKMHAKGKPKEQSQEEGDLCLYAQGHEKSRKSGPISPSSSPTSRSLPVSWRSVLSLQPLNPSHIPQDEWDLLGVKSISRFSSQRSRSTSRGRSGWEEGKRTFVMSAIGMSESSGYSKQPAMMKEMVVQPTKNLVPTRRRGYWALNPLQWFRHCRSSEKQVVDSRTLETALSAQRPCLP